MAEGRHWRNSLLVKRLNMQQRIIFWFNSHRKPREAVWEGNFLHCPRCGDFLYYQRQCIGCGQKMIGRG